MTGTVTLASGSAIRLTLLRNAGLDPAVAPARVDEQSLIAAALAEGLDPGEIAFRLADAKACKVSHRLPGTMVLGCDQVLEFQGRILSKPQDRDEALAQLTALSGQRHRLISAVAIYADGIFQWRHSQEAEMTMRAFSQAWLQGYIDRNWAEIRHCVGCYQLESEGVRLFSRIEGDYFTILGLPLLAVLNYLTERKVLTS